ncbi:MAG: hypothetical protein ACREBB_07775 [Nitrosotalea sp.]
MTKTLEDKNRNLEENLSKDLDKIGRILRKNTNSAEIVKAVRSSRNER